MTVQFVPQDDDAIKITAGLKLQFIAAIRRDPTLSAAQKVIAIAIADFANDDEPNEVTGNGFGQAWLGFKRIREETGLSHSTIRAAIAKFDDNEIPDDEKWLWIERRFRDDGEKDTNWYWPNWEKAKAECKKNSERRKNRVALTDTTVTLTDRVGQNLSCGGAKSALGVERNLPCGRAKSALGGRAKSALNTTYNNSPNETPKDTTNSNPSAFGESPAVSSERREWANDNDAPERKRTKRRGPAALWPDDAFDRFWKLFPNKVGRGAARTAFTKIADTGNVEYDELISGTEKYAKKRDDRPWCNPEKFLNEERWTDQPFDIKQLSKEEKHAAILRRRRCSVAI